METQAAARRPRGYVRVSGRDAEDYLERMLSNDVRSLEVGREARLALLLTPKARVIAPVRVVRRASDDFLLLTEPELAETMRDHLRRLRFATRCEVEVERHHGFLLFGADPPPGAVRNDDYGVEAYEIWTDDEIDRPLLDEEELERMRIEASTPRFGKEIDDRVLPAEAGLVERAVSLGKGCYPGQEPIARLHYRGHVNRSLRVLRLGGDELPEPDAEIRHGEKVVGRVTSAARSDGGVVALGYVRAQVPLEAELAVGSAPARSVH